MEHDDLAEYLRLIGWSKIVLSRRVGVDPATVSRWVNGSSKCPADVTAYLRMIAEFHVRHPYLGLQPQVTPRVAPKPANWRITSGKVRTRAEWAAVADANQHELDNE